MIRDSEYYKNRHQFRKQKRKIRTRKKWDKLKQKKFNRKFFRKEKERLRNQPCVDCQKIIEGKMTFDHVRGEKSFNIGGIPYHVSIKAFELEIQKCDIVCRYCHDIREYFRGSEGYKKLRNLITLKRFKEQRNKLVYMELVKL